MTANRTPRAAPNRWPYREHRTVEQVDAAQEKARRAGSFSRCYAHEELSGEALGNPAFMAARSAEFVERIRAELAR